MADSFDCLCAGIVVADTICQPIARIPAAGALIQTDRVELTIGGCAANIAADMVKLGLKVGLSGRVGQDLFGREVRDRLTAAGVDASQLEVSTTAPTSSTFVLNVQGEDRRFIHCVGANAEYDSSQITVEAIQRSKVMYVGGFCLLESLTPDRVIRLFRVARESGVVTMLNVVLSESTDTTKWLEPVLPWTDYFFSNDDEAQRITQQTDPVKQAGALQALGVKTAVVTLGGHGAILFGPDARLRVSVYPVQPIDSTGTGDAFAAGFLYGVLRGEDVRQCLRLGTAMGASCVRSMGATTGVFRADELTEFVRNNPLSMEAL